MEAEFLIQGCELHNTADKRHVRGDLQVLGTTYIFTADAGAPWVEGAPKPEDKAIYLLGPFFHTRGVFVIHAGDALLNKPAVKYIRENGAP